MTLGQSFESVLEAARLGAEWAWGVLYGEIADSLLTSSPPSCHHPSLSDVRIERSEHARIE